jgi:pSer/pThr/pTyr-binding forkhead associated (FHA) protein
LLEFRENSWFATDLASSNGIRINGERCSAGPLPNGSILSIAEHRFALAYAASLPPIPVATLPKEPRELNSDISQLSATEIPAKPGSGTSPGADPAAADASPAAQRPLGELVPLEGGDAFLLKGIRLLVGRSPACNIVLPFPEVSGKHCQLEWHEGIWHVRDLGSRNGIQVDGKSVTAMPLRPNAILAVAKRRFKVLYEPHETQVKTADDPVATLDLDGVQQTDRVTFGEFPQSLFAFDNPVADEPPLGGGSEA